MYTDKLSSSKHEVQACFYGQWLTEFLPLIVTLKYEGNDWEESSLRNNGNN